MKKQAKRTERAYNVSITHAVYAASAIEAARIMRRDLKKGCSHLVFEVTDLNTRKTITRDLSNEATA